MPNPSSRRAARCLAAAVGYLGFILILIPAAAIAATKTWDGGGADSNCSTIANWSDDAKPTAADDIVLNGTSTKNLTWDGGCPTGVRSWSQNSGYTGTASFSISDFSLSGSLTVGKGTFTAPSGTLTIRGDFTEGDNGTFSHNGGTVVLGGTGAHSLWMSFGSFHNLTIDNGLAGYWKLDEGTGTTIARDSSRYGNHGTLTNGPTWSTDTPSRVRFHDPKGLHFDGTNDYVDAGNDASLNPAKLTIAGWAKPDSTRVGTVAASSIVITTKKGFELFFYNDGNVYFDVGNGTTYGRASTTYTANTWVHLAGTFDGSNVRLYKNGVLVSTTALTGPVSAPVTNTYLGLIPTYGNYFRGFLDDVRIYNRPLSLSEVKALYNGGKSTGSGTYTVGGGNLTVNGALAIYAGTLDVSANNRVVTVGGNVAIHGDLVPRAGTVTLNGSGNQTVSGSTVFWNLTKSVSAAAALFLDYTARQSASGALTLQGTAGNLLSIRSTRSGSGARLLLDGDAGSQSLTYLDVKDNDASGGAALSCLNCTDSANTTNWQFTTSSGNTYLLLPDALNSGGGEIAKSNNYILQDSIGEPIIGFGATANYILESGYRHSVQQGFVSFSCSSTVNIGSVAATGQKTGSGSCVIVTSDETGYNLSWTVTTGSGGTNTGYLISQYNDAIAPFTPTAADTPDTWSVAAADAEWGARLSSRSTDTESEWGIDGASEAWLNVDALTTRSIVSRILPTSGAGSTEIIQFRSEVGASRHQPTGIYGATVTFTAVTL